MAAGQQDERKKIIGVLISGGGSNLQAVIDKCESGALPVDIGVVISSRQEAYGLLRAGKHNIPNFWIDRNAFADADAYDQAIAVKLCEHRVELVVLAGYMRLVGAPVLKSFPNAVINLHPSLLPAFPGAQAVTEALDYGVKVTGVTIHFADAGYDTGPIIIQEIVPVHQEDDENSLLERIHHVEHLHLPYAIKLWASGRLKVEGRKVRILPKSGSR